VRRVVLSVGVLIAVGVALFAVGAALPATTTAERTLRIAAPPAILWAKVTDVAGQAQWRRDVQSIEMIDGGRRWIERTKAGDSIAFSLVERREMERFAIAYQSERGFSGQWVGSFQADGGGARLSMTETVTVPNPLMRLIARVVAPPGSHLDLYLADLTAAL
jgi:hypothetical protein